MEILRRLVRDIPEEFDVEQSLGSVELQIKIKLSKPKYLQNFLAISFKFVSLMKNFLVLL